MTQHLTIPVHRDHWQTANGRYHHHDRARRTRQVRKDARVLAMQLEPVGKLSQVIAYIGYPTNNRADAPNASPTVKAILDGIVDAGILADDDSTHITRTSFERGPKSGTPGMHLIRLELVP